MTNRERGAAHINIYFFLVLLVLFLGTLWFGYIQMSQVNGAEKAAADADAAKLAAQRDLAHYKDYVKEITDVLGEQGEWAGRKGAVWSGRFDGKNPSKLTNVAVPADVTAALQNLAKAMDLSATQATPISGFFGQVVKNYEAKKAEITTALAAVTAAEARAVTLQSNFAKTDAALNKKFNDERAAYQRNQADLRNTNTQIGTRLATSQANEKAANDAMDKQRTEHAEVVKGYVKEAERNHGQMAALSALNHLRRPPQEADGSVISASMEADMAFIDIGRKDMLIRGTKFRITNASGTKVKGWGEVVDTKQDRSQVRLYNVTDKIGDAIDKGDKIYNDLYSPNMKRNVAMIGRFSYPYTKPMIKKLLENLGNTVHDEVKVGVDMVVVGLQEPTEAGDALKPIEETPGYTKAQNLHCEIVTISKIRDLLNIADN